MEEMQHYQVVIQIQSKRMEIFITFGLNGKFNGEEEITDQMEK